MTKWTQEQRAAIDKEGMPILVSAGAGSGKTAVLTERVFRKIKEGVPLNSLLILTFTKAAASEMKERIRTRLLQEGLREAAEQVDASYITTFDSFALSLVKKYHYLVGVPNDIGIVDASIIELQKEKILDQILENLYETEEPHFCNLISRFCTKDDTDFKSDILNIHNKLNLKYDKLGYLDNYMENEMSESHIDVQIDAYLKLIQVQITELKDTMEELEFAHKNYYEQVRDILTPLLESSTYEDIKTSVNVTLPRVPENENVVKEIKEKISAIMKEITRLTRFDSTKQLRDDLISTKEDIEVIISILTALEQELNQWKKENNLYEFHDIAKMAIRVVEENASIQEEQRNHWNEILLDEYQDTSDLQEILIQLIANNNVYMVGDMKQSIYRFRNANPIIFKTKYDGFKEGKEGIKIDLTSNFRSRKEPLDDINFIFNRILQEETGGADYEHEHQMVFGNLAYEQATSEQNMHMRLLEYDTQDDYHKEEIEAFIVANDIEDKIRNHFQVMDSETKELRDITYRDFVILMDRTTQFDTYKKIFDDKQIPLTVHKDETITSGIEIRLFYHILKCMQKMELHEFDEEWKYAFVSISRSYLLEEKDPVIFDTIQNGTYENTRLWGHIENLLQQKNSVNNELLLQAIIKEFDFEQAFIKIGHVEESMVRTGYLLSLAKTLSQIGYDWYDMMNFLGEIADKKYEIRFGQNKEAENSVSIMTIHKSKGLEFPICYYTGLYAKFNKSDLKERMTYDEAYGFVIPTTRNGIQNTIRKDLMKYEYQKQEIAEKIRLFYVALTRAREQMIMVLPKILECPTVNVIPLYQVLHYQSFADMIASIHGNLEPYVEEVKPVLSLDYQLHKPFIKKEITGVDILKVTPIEVAFDQLKETSFSKKLKTTIEPDQYKNIEFGKYVHQVLQYFDFMKPDYTGIPTFLQEKIKKFLATPIFQENPIHIYQEYEFYGMKDEEQIHGIIDLMVEYEDEIKIVDYKLKQIDDKAYVEQLRGYQSYIETITPKKVTTYLYSILDETLEKIS